MNKLKFCIGLLFPILLAGLLAWYDDPFLILRKDNGAVFTHLLNRTALAFRITKYKPRTILMGTSRIGAFPLWYFGNNTQLNVNPIIKAPLPDGSIPEFRAYLEHAQATQPLKLVIMETGFRSFYTNIPSEYNPDRLARVTQPANRFLLLRTRIKDIYGLLFSFRSIERVILDMLDISWKTQLDFEDRINRILRPAQYPIIHKDILKLDPLRELRNIIDFAQTNNINLILFVPPLHATYELDAIEKEAKGGDAIEQWKRDITAIIESKYTESGIRYPLWDFGGFNSITTEEQPPAEGDGLKWFSNPSHFSQDTAIMMLNKMFGLCEDPCSIPEDFGILLTQDSIEMHLAQIRRERALYIKTRGHP